MGLNYTDEELAEVLKNPHIQIDAHPDGSIRPPKVEDPGMAPCSQRGIEGARAVAQALDKVLTEHPELKRQSEAVHQVKVINLLHQYGWLVHAERHAWTKKGYRTPIQGDAGWFDIAAIHPVRHLFLLLELKADNGRLSPFQEKWIMAANQCPGVKVLILRPEDMAEFEERVK